MVARKKSEKDLRQRCVRAAHRFRQNLKLYIFSPFLWELETQLLGEKLKAHLPKDYTKQKIQQHRQAWATRIQNHWSPSDKVNLYCYRVSV